MLGYADKVVFVPGYGMAVAQAQHELHALADLLETRGVEVSVRHPPGGGANARPHERAARRGERSLRQLKEMDETNRSSRAPTWRS